MESILQIQEKYAVDDSIKSLETYAFQPISGTQLNSAGQITIRSENQDAFFFPRRSWLQIEGKLVKETGGGDFATGDKITLTSNALLHLFDNVKYELSGHEIVCINFPGFNPVQWAIICVNNEYDAILNGTPKPISADL